MRVSDEAIYRITFDRPDVRNAMTTDVAAELADVLGDLDPESHDAAVITGAGAAFCAGGDIDAMAERDWTTAEAYERVRATFGRVAENALSAPVPIVAKVNGDAVGAGLSLVAVSDFAYAAESARFGATFVNVGLIPDMGATAILPHLIGLRKTKELAFTGDLVDADEAAAMELVNETVPDDELDSRVDDLLETLRNRPTANVGLAKEAIHDSLGTQWRDGLRREAKLQSMAYDTAAHEEGVDAFREGRKPDFD
ncbi:MULTISPECIES: enoyl-CoA hydratase/isomerase family protein [Halolamina]|uniref:Enoyl-CoA hydratase/carnithine racemase n=1 Tax=Halolamina pelagica TaxID=699431 RepID=A0A1I5NSG1_9EURY|nr:MULTISPECIES: enoyl-CoA hydratase-related protein [Halolamina]NHX36458.1 enoyl-CoA hydratase/isomerase family protein [Halolamina sp. R1-12]SFP24778.1 Enoyl-CoA hydratase/carnithine racemase [Halolamina pelagica]